MTQCADSPIFEQVSPRTPFFTLLMTELTLLPLIKVSSGLPDNGLDDTQSVHAPVVGVILFPSLNRLRAVFCQRHLAPKNLHEVRINSIYKRMCASSWSSLGTRHYVAPAHTLVRPNYMKGVSVCSMCQVICVQFARSRRFGTRGEKNIL